VRWLKPTSVIHIIIIYLSISSIYYYKYVQASQQLPTSRQPTARTAAHKRPHRCITVIVLRGNVRRREQLCAGDGWWRRLRRRRRRRLLLLFQIARTDYVLLRVSS
jgi:hypothetical protein